MLVVILSLLFALIGFCVGYVIGKWVSPLLKMRTFILVYDDEENLEELLKRLIRN